MAEGLQTPDGAPVDVASVDQEFARAMAAPPAEDIKELPKRQEPAQAAPKRRGRPPKNERARTADKATVEPQSDEQRHSGVKGLAQLGAGLALMAGKATGQPAFQADAIVLATNAEAFADAAVATAQADARFARVLDKVTAVGPYGALLSVAVGTGMQIIRNHKPSAVLPGTVPPEELLKAAEEANGSPANEG